MQSEQNYSHKELKAGLIEKVLDIPFIRSLISHPLLGSILNAEGLACPSTTLPPSSSLDSGGSLTFGFSKTLPSSSGSLVDLSGYEPKVISACRKIASNPSFRQLRDELKRSQLINYKGCISVRNWSAIFANHSFSLTKSENGALSRVFRAKGIPDTLNCKEFLDVCMAVQGSEC